ncbi:MAG: glycosyltransferase family 2 protein [Thermoleophilaceae bacterium]
MSTASTPAAAPTVSAVVLAFNREQTLGLVLDRLEALPVDEVIVVDNGSADGTAAVARSRGGRVRAIEAGRNLGIAGRNLGAREARGELLLMLDDDSHPLPGATETMVDAFRRRPDLGVAGGLLLDVDSRGQPVPLEQAGSFDWFLRGGSRGPAPPDGLPAFFFPEGACMIRRRAFVEAGGWFEPFFLGGVEVELAARLLARGWDVRYLPDAPFEHLRRPTAQPSFGPGLQKRIRNQIWYFWLRFPLSLALRRIPAYLAFDLVECLYRRALGAWAGGIVDAWRQRELIRGERAPLPRALARRAEMNRGRLHLRLLALTARRLARRARGEAPADTPATIPGRIVE